MSKRRSEIDCLSKRIPSAEKKINATVPLMRIQSVRWLHRLESPAKLPMCRHVKANVYFPLIGKDRQLGLAGLLPDCSLQKLHAHAKEQSVVELVRM
jgi:hypothetical protein